MEEDEDGVDRQYQDQLGPVDWEEEEDGEGLRATKRRRRSLGDEAQGAQGELVGREAPSQQEERIHRSLRQLEIDLGKVKELITGERFKSYQPSQSSISPMSSAEVAPPPPPPAAGGPRMQPGVGLVRRRYNNNNGTTTTLLSPDAPPAMLVTSARSTVRDEVGGGAAGRGSAAGRPRTHHGAPTAGAGRRRHHTTLAVISLDSTPVNTDEDAAEQASNGIINGRHFRLQPSPRNRAETYGTTRTRGSADLNGGGEAASGRNAGSYRYQDDLGEGEHHHHQPQFTDGNSNSNNNKDISEYCCVWPLSLLNDKPVFRLFLVMFLNGLLSMACSAAIMEIERPEQLERMSTREELQRKVDVLHSNLTDLINKMGTEDYDGDRAVALLDKYSEAVPDLGQVPDEIEWDMLNAQAFITSVQTTTGYGDIIPVTSWGKLFTVLYAFVGIPVFMWYIVKLGALFRLVIMKLFYGLLVCLFPGIDEVAPPGHHRGSEPEFENVSAATPEVPRNRVSMDHHHLQGQRQGPSHGGRARKMSTLTRIRLLDLNMRLKQQYYSDKRFHPMVIGTILAVFLACVAAFISYMEDISYFDSFYAAFITYSTIGFGDIDIFKISYRSNWFNLLIYGNFIHIAGYMILSAWVSSLLEKCGVRKY